MTEKEYKEKLDILAEESSKLWHKSLDMPTWEEARDFYWNHPTVKEYNKLYREFKVIRSYNLSPFSDLDRECLMTFKEFESLCKHGFFSDYDGSGRYATEDKISDIRIEPSDIIVGVYRKDFTHVCWFNK